MSSIIKKNIWGIILAGGEGLRLKNFLNRQYNFFKPKQFCNIIGTRSLYKHTYDRAAMMIPEDQIITVITDQHYRYIQDEFEDLKLEQIISQPVNKDTGPAILLSIIKLYTNNPESIVVIFPSDHFILEEQVFLEHVEEAVSFISYNNEKILLLGIKPYMKTTSYGCIIPGEMTFHSRISSIYKVDLFLEKPSPECFENRITKNYLWNSMVLIGKCATFLKVIQNSLPKVSLLFKGFFNERDAKNNYSNDRSIFNTIPKMNFSKDILEKIVKHLFVMELKNVFWSDWGEEDKIHYTLNKLKRKNAIEAFV